MKNSSDIFIYIYIYDKNNINSIKMGPISKIKRRRSDETSMDSRIEKEKFQRRQTKTSIETRGRDECRARQ